MDGGTTPKNLKKIKRKKCSFLLSVISVDRCYDIITKVGWVKYDPGDRTTNNQEGVWGDKRERKSIFEVYSRMMIQKLDIPNCFLASKTAYHL